MAQTGKRCALVSLSGNIRLHLAMLCLINIVYLPLFYIQARCGRKWKSRSSNVPWQLSSIEREQMDNQ